MLFGVKTGEIGRSLAIVNPWWRGGGAWQRVDPDLAAAAGRPLRYEPKPLHGLVPGGLYMLRGPRRVGKSLELKRAIARLIESGVNPRHIIHYPCDRLTAADLPELERIGRSLSGPGDAPRWWFLDEISSITDGWPANVKWLRDNTALRRDCVVLTGSSSRDLHQAQDELAGRRGPAVRSDRHLMPMGFRDFARASAAEVGSAPTDTLALADLADHGQLASAIHEVIPWLDVLGRAWEHYLTIGGYPMALNDWLERAEVSVGVVEALWDIVHGDAFRQAGLGPAHTQGLLEELSRRLANPTAELHLAREVGLVDGSGRPDGQRAGRRLHDLEVAYITWRCHQRQPERDLPALRAFSKVYFCDPLLGRLAHLRNPLCTDPDPTLLTEQQIGRALSLALESERPGSLLDFAGVLHRKTPTGKEIDFVGAAFARVGIDCKYIDHGLARAGATLRAQVASGTIDRGILATRSVIALDDEPVWAIPAAILAWLLPALPDAQSSGGI